MPPCIKLLVTASQLACISISYAAARNLMETPDASPPKHKEMSSEQHEILKKQKIYPKIVADQPNHVLLGDYNGKEISFGNVFTREEIKKKPDYLDWPVNGTRYLYCLVAIGIDIPNKDEPKLKDFRHWLVGNIPGNDIAKGEEVLPYIGAGNFYDEGPHRIVFIVYKQPGNRKMFFYERKLRAVQPISVARGNSSTTRFAAKYNFRQPVAVNFLTVETDTPQSTTDYYEVTKIVVPPDWQGVSIVPETFGFTFDIPKDD